MYPFKQLVVFFGMLFFIQTCVSVLQLRKQELESCLSVISKLDPTTRWNALGVAWNILQKDERYKILQEIAKFENEAVTESELVQLSELKDDDVHSKLDDQHDCIPSALKTSPTSIWRTMSDAERHLTYHELRTSL